MKCDTCGKEFEAHIRICPYCRSRIRREYPTPGCLPAYPARPEPVRYQAQERACQPPHYVSTTQVAYTQNTNFFQQIFTGRVRPQYDPNRGKLISLFIQFCLWILSMTCVTLGSLIFIFTIPPVGILIWLVFAGIVTFNCSAGMLMTLRE